MITNPSLATALALHGKAMRVPAAATIYQPGEQADGVYILRAGQIDLQLIDEHQTPFWSRTMPAYSILGLSAAIGHYDHCVRAVARESSDVVFVPAGELAEVIRTDTSLGSEILMLISTELCDLYNKARMLKFGLKHHRNGPRRVSINRSNERHAT
jgi:CRP/FNR family transcriptional regulator, cyclic AMP receptor protein